MSWFLVIDHIPALPEALLLVGACLVMIVDLYVKSERRTLSFVLAQVVLALCALVTLLVLALSHPAKYYLFNGLFVADSLSHLLKLACYVAVSAALVYSRAYLADRGLLRGEFISLLLFSLLGMMVMVSASSFLTVYLGLELMSLCLYAMVALNRDSAASTEAAMKYFVLGALASGLLLYGMSMIYGATGSLDIREVAFAVSRLAESDVERRFLVFGLVFLVSGLAFKIGVVPFHMWIPDVYHGAPTPVTLVIAAGPKLAAFGMAIRLLVNALPGLAADWQQMLVVLSVASMALGNIAAIAQTNLKRMLAYSAIAHMGFMLLGLLSGVVEGNARNAADAYSAALFYAVIYALMSLGAFGVLLYLSRAGFDCENLDDMRGLNRRSPWTAFLMLLVMFSLTGIPPTAGFYAKVVVISATVSAGYIWLAVAAVLFSLVGAFYYLRVVKLMYFDDAVDASALERRPGFAALLSVNGLLLLLWGVLPSGLLNVCLEAIQAL
jgi:NADH-quinone oxidoreductase subunit N